MKNQHSKIEKLIKKETTRIKKKRPFLEKIDFVYEENKKGTYLTKLRAKTHKKTFLITEENHCPEISVKKVFNNLSRILGKKKMKRSKRMTLEMQGAA